jgi:hypothetical protein
MKLRLALSSALAMLVAGLSLVGATASAPAAPAAKPKAPAAGVDVPVTGTVTNRAGTVVGTFAGDYTIDRVIRQGRRLKAVGTVTGVVTNTATGTTQVVNRAVKIPLQARPGGTGARAGGANAVAPQQASCQILDLTLGPLDLDLLGLVIHLDTVHLNITAEQAPGNLLGNLLCAVVGLLDPPTGGGGGLGGVLNQIVALLNQILNAIGG